MKNFNPSWTEKELYDLFSKYGDIKSVFIAKSKDKDGNEKPFAFVCFEKTGDPSYGPIAADNAVNDIHGKEVEGSVIYAQPALPSLVRYAQLARDQQRYKNSKKKCNLFVKGFPQNYNEEKLREHFSTFGEIESIKFIASTDNVPNSRAFICYKTPDSASNARMARHNYIVDGKPLYVTNYELPEIRKK